MSHNQRLDELIKKEGLNYSQFSKSISYTLKNLMNYLKGKTADPNGGLVRRVLEHYPHWNMRYWLLGQGDLVLKDDKIVIIKEPTEPYKQGVVKELTEQLAYMREENQRKDELSQNTAK